MVLQSTLAPTSKITLLPFKVGIMIAIAGRFTRNTAQLQKGTSHDCTAITG